MYFDKKYQIWMATVTDSFRPVLQHVYVCRVAEPGTRLSHFPLNREYLISKLHDREMNGVMLATDGIIFAAIPCMLQENDIPGHVKASIFKYAKSISKGRVGNVYMTLGEDRVTVSDGSTHIRQMDLSRPWPYRNLNSLSKKVWPPDLLSIDWPKTDHFVLDTKLSTRLYKALGINSRGGHVTTGIRVYATNEYGQFIIKSFHGGQPQEIPFGIQMALHKR